MSTTRATMGSIPARAGEPARDPGRAGFAPVYPRACGGTALHAVDVLPAVGLSPRVRGNLGASLEVNGRSGSIPARAGEPPARFPVALPELVYPRACGGTFRTRSRPPRRCGLSPRVRGNHRAGDAAEIDARSIPARAGEPKGNEGTRHSEPVYPRACGGTGLQHHRVQPEQGLSPRVRGNPRTHWTEEHHDGSIPARAGEPAGSGCCRAGAGVYPRACGGTPLDDVLVFRESGLSPRVRGNPQDGQVRVRPVGSIPARAGEPRDRSVRPHRRWVYPRACGGTSACRPPPPGSSGLSPRVRGNLTRIQHCVVPLRSIPARAGEPAGCVQASQVQRVYPRACGGTLTGPTSVSVCVGLSPRVRGNLQPRQVRHSQLRSIPARAGEPRIDTLQMCMYAVYPRACGGTANSRSISAMKYGLSPRVRGNPPTISTK